MLQQTPHHHTHLNPSGTSVAVIKENVINLILTSCKSKNQTVTNAQLKIALRRYQFYELFLYGEETCTVRLPPPPVIFDTPYRAHASYHTCLLRDNERPWFVLQRPILGPKCHLLFRSPLASQDLPPLHTPFNVSAKYLGPRLAATWSNLNEKSRSSTHRRKAFVDITISSEMLPPALPITVRNLIKVMSSRCIVKSHTFRCPPHITSDHAIAKLHESIDIQLDLWRESKKKEDLNALKYDEKSNFSLEEWRGALISLHIELQLLIFGLVSHQCTLKSCPDMCVSESISYMWSAKNSVPISETQSQSRIVGNESLVSLSSGVGEVVSASVYITKLIEWVGTQLTDDLIFTTSKSTLSSKQKKLAEKKAKKSMFVIHRRLFRIYAHVFFKHIAQLVSEGLVSLFKIVFLILQSILMGTGLPKKEVRCITAPTEELVLEFALKDNKVSLLQNLELAPLLSKKKDEDTSVTPIPERQQKEFTMPVKKMLRPCFVRMDGEEPVMMDEPKKETSRKWVTRGSEIEKKIGKNTFSPPSLQLSNSVDMSSSFRAPSVGQGGLFQSGHSVYQGFSTTQTSSQSSNPTPKRYSLAFKGK
jgi:hypothetical protein